MANPYLKKQQLLFIATQVDETTEATITGTHAIQVYDISVTPLKGQSAKLDNITGSSGYQGSVRHGDYSEISFKVYLRQPGSGSLGVRPGYSDAFLMSAMAITENAGTDVVVTPVEPDAGKFATIHYYIGNQLHKLVGCMGECKKTIQGIPYYEFKAIGQYFEPETNSPPAHTYASLKKPVPVTSDNTTVQLYGQTVGVNTLTIDYGRRVTYHEDTGQKYVIQTADEAMVTIEFSDPGLDVNNYWSVAHGGDVGALAIQHGIDAGRILEVSVPVMDISDVNRTVNDNKPSALKVTCGILDDDWSFLMR